MLKLKSSLLVGEISPNLSQEYKERNICNGFHATEDKQDVRNEVFKIISTMREIVVHSIIVRKNRTHPNLYPPEKFYPKISSFLIDYIQKRYRFSKLCVMFNGSPVDKKKQAMLKGLKEEISKKGISREYYIYFPNSSTERMLDVADYICWAIAKKWEKNDERSYDMISKFLGTGEKDIFRNGERDFY